MIPLEEIEVLVKKVFGKNVISVWQVNKTTIRIELIKDSFIDIFQSVRSEIKFAFHAEVKGGKIFRLDCRPERKYQKLKTFPWHLHKGKEDKVVASPFSERKKPALEQFFNFIKKEIKTSS